MIHWGQVHASLKPIKLLRVEYLGLWEVFNWNYFRIMLFWLNHTLLHWYLSVIYLVVLGWVILTIGIGLSDTALVVGASWSFGSILCTLRWFEVLLNIRHMFLLTEYLPTSAQMIFRCCDIVLQHFSDTPWLDRLLEGVVCLYYWCPGYLSLRLPTGASRLRWGVWWWHMVPMEEVHNPYLESSLHNILAGLVQDCLNWRGIHREYLGVPYWHHVYSLCGELLGL